MKKINLKKIDNSSQVPHLVKWLNQKQGSDIQRTINMTNTTQQEAWVKSSIDNQNARYYFYSFDAAEPIGFCGIESIDWISRTCSIFVHHDKHDDLANPAEVFEAITRIAFKDLGLNKVSVSLMAENTPLIKNLEKWGFVKEVRKRQHYFYDKSYHHIVEMAMLASEFNNDRFGHSISTN